MKCSKCGNAAAESALVCGTCASAKFAVWSNAYAVLLLATVSLVDAVFLRTTVPTLVERFSAANQALPISPRILIASSGFTAKLAPGVFIASVAVAAVMRHERIRVAIFVKNGEMLLLAAWVAVAGSLIALAVAAGHLLPVG